METMVTYEVKGCCSGCGERLRPSQPPTAASPWTFIQIGDKAYHSGCAPKEQPRARTEGDIYETVLAEMLSIDSAARARVFDRLLAALPMARGGAVADPNYDHECG